MPTSAKAGSEATSRATTRVARSRAAGRSAAPDAEDSSRNQNSPHGELAGVAEREQGGEQGAAEHEGLDDQGEVVGGVAAGAGAGSGGGRGEAEGGTVAVAQRDEEGQGGDESGDGQRAEERLAVLGEEEVGDQDDQGHGRDDDRGCDREPVDGLDEAGGALGRGGDEVRGGDAPGDDGWGHDLPPARSFCTAGSVRPRRAAGHRPARTVSATSGVQAANSYVWTSASCGSSRFSPMQTRRTTMSMYAAVSRVPNAAIDMKVRKAGLLEAVGGVEGAEQGEHLAPESGEARQAQGGDGGEGEEAAEAGCPAVERGPGRPGEGVEVGGAVPVLDCSDQEEQQPGDEAVGDVGEERAVDPGGRHARDAEEHEAHVADGGVRDQALEVALGAGADQRQAGQRSVDDADDREGGEVGREGVHPVGSDGEQDADESVRAHLQQDAREQDRADGRGGGVGVRQPAVQRPHRCLHGESDADRQNGDDLHGRGEPTAVVSGECHHVEGAALQPDEEQAQQHDHRAEQCVEDELPGGGLPLRTAPAGDEEVHRDEHHLERQEEQQQVEDGEGREGAGLQDEQEGDESLRGGAAGSLK